MMLKEFLQELVTKLSTYPNIKHVGIGESLDIAGISDAQFPRFEILITKDKRDGYVDQFTIAHEYRFSVGVFTRNASYTRSEQDMYDLIDIAEFVSRKILEFNIDKMSNENFLNGFVSIHGYPETFYEYELVERTNGALVTASALFDEQWRS
jgi:hypothetical protein